MPSSSQTFLRELDKNRAERDRLPKRAARRVRAGARINRRTAADRLRSNLDTAIYKHAVLPALAIRSDDTLVVTIKKRATGTETKWRWPEAMSPLPNLGALIDLIATIPFQHADLHAKDIRSDDTLVVRRMTKATGVSPLPNSFTQDQHPDLRADYVMALPSAAARSYSRSHTADRPAGRINPPFNIKERWDGKLEGDARWSRSEAELIDRLL